METTLVLWCIVFFVTFSQGHELVISHKPSYVRLDEKSDSIRVTDIQYALSAVHGFTLHKELSYHGLYALSPFKHPRASSVLALYGGEQIVQQLEGNKLNLKDDDVYIATHSLRHNLESFYGSQSNIVEISHNSKANDFDGILEGLSDSSSDITHIVGGVYSTNLFNSTNPEIAELLKQVALIVQSEELVAKNGAGQGDFYSFELHIPTSESASVTAEVNGLVKALIAKVDSAMRAAYGSDYISIVLSLPESSVKSSRKSRSVLGTEDSVDMPSADEINLAIAYSADYPVIFHIILWLSVFMALLVIFVTYGMMTMDPGTDSIIYRMTTTRLKKD